jgi:hypothetical protein
MAIQRGAGGTVSLTSRRQELNMIWRAAHRFEEWSALSGLALLPAVSFNSRTSLNSLWSKVAVDFSDPGPHPMTSMHIPLLLRNYLHNKALSKTANQGVDFSEGREFVLIVARLIVLEAPLLIYTATKSQNRVIPLGVPYRTSSQEMLPFTALSVSFSSLNSSSPSFFMLFPT